MTANTKKTGAVTVPAKKTMNFIRPRGGFEPKRIIPGVILVLVLGALFAKFAILDPLARKEEAGSELVRKQAQLEALTDRLAGYEELEKQYGRYSCGWMNEQEVSLVSRMDMLELVEEKIAPVAVIEDMAVNSNVLTMHIHGITLEQAGALVKSLEQSPLVISASVNEADADDAREARIFLSILLTREAE